MIPSTHGGFLSPESTQRAMVDFIPEKEKKKGNDQIMHCTIKQLLQACQDVEEILNIDSIPLDIVAIVGRILDINWKVSRQMMGEIPYTELTLTDSTDMIFIQIYKNDDKENLFDYFMRANNLKGDPKILLNNMYIRAFVSPKKNETEKKWKYNCRFIEQINDFNILTYHFLKCITGHLERTIGILSPQTKESLYLLAQNKKANAQQQLLEQQQQLQIQNQENNQQKDSNNDLDKEIQNILGLPAIDEESQEDDKIDLTLINYLQDTKSEEIVNNNQKSDSSFEFNISQLLKEEEKNKENNNNMIENQFPESTKKLIDIYNLDDQNNQLLNEQQLEVNIIKWIKQNSDQINQQQVINYFQKQGISINKITQVLNQLCEKKILIDTGSQFLTTE